MSGFLDALKSLHSINGQLNTKLVYGAVTFFCFIIVGIYGVLNHVDNVKFEVVFWGFLILTSSLFGIGSYDLKNIKKNGK